MDLIELLFDRFWDTLADFVLWVMNDIDANPQKAVFWGAVVVGIILWIALHYHRQAVNNAKGMGAFKAYEQVAMKGVVVETSGFYPAAVAVLTIIVIALVWLLLQ